MTYMHILPYPRKFNLQVKFFLRFQIQIKMLRTRKPSKLHTATYQIQALNKPIKKQPSEYPKNGLGN